MSLLLCKGKYGNRLIRLSEIEAREKVDSGEIELMQKDVYRVVANQTYKTRDMVSDSPSVKRRKRGRPRKDKEENQQAEDAPTSEGETE